MVNTYKYEPTDDEELEQRITAFTYSSQHESPTSVILHSYIISASQMDPIVLVQYIGLGSGQL